MQSRVILLRVLLWSLGVAAVFGAAGVLLQGFGIGWRFPVTAVVTAMASAVLLLTSPFLHKPKTRPAALLLVYLTVVEYLLMLVGVWELPHRLAGWHVDDFRLWMSIVHLFVTGVAAAAFVLMIAIPTTAVAGWVGTAVSFFELVLLLVVTWTWNNWAEEAAGALVPFALMAIACLIGAGRDGRHWRWIGVAACAIGFGLYVYGESDLVPAIRVDVLVPVIATAAVVAHANLVFLCHLLPRQLWLRRLTIAFALVTAVAVNVDAWGPGPWYGDVAERIGAASAILAGCGTLAVFVLAMINHRFNQPGVALADVRQLTFLCPVCRRKQPAQLGRHTQCPGCNVIVHVRLEEPRCQACGYSLLMLQADRCPECGARVADPKGGAAAIDVPDAAVPQAPLRAAPSSA